MHVVEIAIANDATDASTVDWLTLPHLRNEDDG